MAADGFATPHRTSPGRPRRFVDAEAAATFLGFAPKSLTTRRWRERRGIPAYKFGPRTLRFDLNELRVWISRHRETPPEAP